MIVTGISETCGEPSGSRSTSWCTRNFSSSRPGKSVRWWAPRDSSPAQARGEHDLGDVEHVGELQGGDQLGVEAAARVPDPHPERALLQLLQPVDALRPCRARSGRCRRRPPSSLCISVRIGATRRRRAGCRGAARGVAPRRPPARRSTAGGGPALAAYVRGRPAGAGPEDQALGQRVGAEPVGAVDAHARGLARGVQPGERRRAVDVGVDAAHHVVHDRADRDQLGDRVDPLVLQAQLAHERQLGVDQLLAEVPQVEVDDRPVLRLDGTALLDLVDERLREPVARAELHAAQLRLSAWAVPRS